MLWFLIGCFVGCNIGYIIAAFTSASKDND